MREFHSITLFFFKKICLVIFLGCLQLGYSQTYTVTNTNDSGPGSLRQGIEDANAGLVDTILFSLASESVITLEDSPLPSLQQKNTVIDGSNDGIGLATINFENITGTNPALIIQADSVSIFNLILKNNNNSGISIETPNKHLLISNCEIYSCQDGISIGFDSCTVINCSIHDNTESGIVVKSGFTGGVNQFLAKNNTIYGNGHYGIFLQFGSEYHLLKNKIGIDSKGNINGNNGDGIRYWVPTDAVIDSNIIVANLGHGINIGPGGSAQIKYNHIGIFSDSVISNLESAISTSSFNNGYIYKNIISSIDTSAIVISGSNNKVSQNSILIPQGNFMVDKAILLLSGGNNSKDTATITSYALSPTTLTLSGTSDPQDSIEVFINDGTPQNALEYLGTAKADASGNWSLILDRGSAFTEGSLNYYVTTATDMANNTSELSAPFVVLPESCIVTNANDAGAGSLRAAMECAATMPGPDTITFNIPGTGEHMITLESSLPTIELDTVVIDGSTQPEGEIVLNGSSSYSGVSIQSTALSGVKDIDFYNFPTAIGFRGCINCFVDSCNIKNVNTGISINFFSDSVKITNNTISNTTQNGINLVFNVKYGAVSGNTIDSCGEFAIQFTGDSDNNLIANNKLSNGDKVGIQMCCSAENTFLDNTIQNFGEGGISLSGAVNNNTFINNTILNNTDFGIKISDNSLRDTLIGNTIGGTSGVGVLFESGAKYHYLKGNYIGLSSAFDSLGNASHGIQTTPGCNSISLVGNHIGFSGQEGIRNASDSTIIKNNFIGGNGTHAFPNLSNGIGFFAPSRYIKVRNNYIGENQGAGLFMQNYGTQGNLLSQNIFIDNAGEAIDMDVQTNGNSGNANKATPYITAISRNGNEYTLTIEAETNDVLIEVFEGDSSRKNALAFLTNNLNNLGDGVWQTTITTEQTNPQFSVTSTAADSSTSALGFYIEDCFVVYSTADDGLGSLREAIACANMAPDTNTITFNIPGDGPHEISLTTPLPQITESVLINGIQNKILTSLNSISDYGFDIRGANAGGTTIKGFKINNASSAGIFFQFTENITIDSVEISNSDIGIFANGDSTVIKNSYIHDNSSDGIYFPNSSNILLENNSVLDNQGNGFYSAVSGGAHTIINNIISGNALAGIHLSRVFDALIDGNIIGLDSTKRNKKPNGFLETQMDRASGIYGSFSASFTITNNYIGGNAGHGIGISDRVPLFVYGNYIGTNEFGDDLGNDGDGIYAAQSNLTIGNTLYDSSNVIGFNGGNGIQLISTSSTIKGNYIGVNPNGVDIHNDQNGIIIQTNIIISNNFIGFNLENGILTESVGNRLEDNYIGIGPNGENWGNVLYGIESSSGNDIIQNTIGNNGFGGIHSTSSFNWVSKTTFENNNGLAIDWDMARDSATITGRSILGNTLTLTGTGPEGDSVEVFLSDGLPQNALVYAGTALVNGGTWSLDILEDNVAFSTLQNNYYVTTATNNAQTSTSELSQPFLVPAYLCNITRTDLLSDTLGVCQNDSLLLASPVAGVNTTWYKDETLYTNDSSFYTQAGGEYVLELEDTYGCKTYDTVQVVENPVPLVADFLVSSYTDIDDELVIVNVSYTQPDSVVWDFGNADVMDEGLYYVLTFPDTGSYEITLTSYLDYCVNSRTKTIEVLEEYSSPGNILKASFDIKSVQVFPNPTTGIFTAKVILTQQKNISWTFFDAQSNIVTQGTLSGKSTYEEIIDIQSLPAGTYFLRITTDRDTRIVRIIKQ